MKKLLMLLLFLSLFIVAGCNKKIAIETAQVQENSNNQVKEQASISNTPVQDTVASNTTNQQTQDSNPSPSPTCKPSITVLSPRGGETFILGQTINITWSSKCIDSNALVYLNIGIKDSQAVSELLDGMKVANTGSYNFTIPNNYNLGHTSGQKIYQVSINYIYGNGEGVGGYSNSSFTINSSETTQIKVYFAKKSFSGCSIDIKATDLDYFYRSIPKTQAVARASIEELLKGPTQEENNKGYMSDIPDGTYIKSITITNGEALVDFNGKIENGVTSCGGGMRIWQIRQTLLQFPTIKTVKFSVDGRTEDIFQA